MKPATAADLPKGGRPSTRLQVRQGRRRSPTPGPKPDAKIEPEVVTVKYRGPVNLAPFKCDAITRSSFIERVCYDAANSYMLIDLNGTWYHYCEIDSSTVSSLMAADSMGQFYNRSIKGASIVGRIESHPIKEFQNRSRFSSGAQKIMGKEQAPARSPSYRRGQL